MSFLLGPLTAAAIADALLCGVEFLPRFPKKDLLHSYRQHTMWPQSAAGSYSDDTQRLAAVTDWMIKSQYTQESFAKILLDTWVKDVRGGSPRMHNAFIEAETKGIRLDKLPFEKTEGAGAAMGAGILGCLSESVAHTSERRVIDASAIQAKVTHRGDGILAAQAAALMAHYHYKEAWYNTKHKMPLREYLVHHLKDERFGNTSVPKKIANGMECVLAALYVLDNATSLSEILTQTADLGGDSDTIGVIAISAVWMSERYKADLPDHLWFGLENGPTGRNYLRQKEKKLAQHFPSLRLRACGV